MPHWTGLLATAPHTTIDASELQVGLPEGQMGNSEVGHLNIGAGRVVYQDYTRIDHAIATGEFAANPVLGAAAENARDHGTALHVLGLVDGSVDLLRRGMPDRDGDRVARQGRALQS